MNNDFKNTAPTANDLLGVLRKLRSPEGCPWDREQTRETLRQYLIEETAELADAIDQNNTYEICEEIGDVLLNLMMQSLVAEEQGEFTFDESVKLIYDKMIRRHPHVFGSAEVKDSSEVTKLWEKIKQSEPDKAQRESIMDGVPKALPSLYRAEKLQKKAAKCGFDWLNTDQIMEKITEELSEVKEALAEGDDAHIDEELGDLLFATVNMIRFRQKSSDQILRQANQKFERRFRYVEKGLKEQNKTVSPENLELAEELWNEAKKSEKK